MIKEKFSKKTAKGTGKGAEAKAGSECGHCQQDLGGLSLAKSRSRSSSRTVLKRGLS
jgi:hypothetical protein